MKRTMELLVAGGVLLLAMSPVAAFADNGPHVKSASMSTDSCAGCHRAHTAQGAYLLVSPELSLCYTCHGGTGAGATTKVENGQLASGGVGTGQALRGGGFAYALIDSGNATRPSISANAVTTVSYPSLDIVPAKATGSATTSNHSIDGTVQTSWGNGAIGSGVGKAGVALECTSCHDPHGNGNFRILKPIPADSGSLSSPASVTIPDDPGKVYTTANYWSVDNADNGQTLTTANPNSTTPWSTAQTPFIANISNWCSTCHTRYNAPSGSWGVDSGDPTYRYRHTGNGNSYKGTAAQILANGGASVSNNGNGSKTSQPRSCVQCHVAHGSNASMAGDETDPLNPTHNSGSTVVSTTGAIPGNQGAALNPDGTETGNPGSMLLRVDNRGTCRMCHNEGYSLN